MTTTYDLHAEARADLGTGASRRLRRTGKVPAVVYGDAREPQSIMLTHNEIIRKLQEEAFYSSILNLHIDGEPQRVVLKDLQRHPYKPTIMHADFLRVNDNITLQKRVPLHFTNEDLCIGVRTGGGMVQHFCVDITVECLPNDLPAFIEIDMKNLEVGQRLTLSNLPLPEGVTIPALRKGKLQDVPVVQVKKGRT